MNELIRSVFGEGPGDETVDIRAGLRDAVLREGRSPFEIIREVVQLSRKPNRLTVDEYFAYRIYRGELDNEQRRTFLGKKGAGHFHGRTIDSHYVAVGRDKLLFHQIMKGEGLPVPDVLALYHPYRRLGTGAELRNRDDLAEFLLRDASYPLFSKPVRERKSLGAQRWRGANPDDGTVITWDGRAIPVDRLYWAIEPFERFGYMFQESLTPDDRLEKIAGTTLSTIRVTVLLDDQAPHVFRAGWKIPTMSNSADNFWREGNMLAAVDVETGEVGRVVRGKGAGQEVVTEHPDTEVVLTDVVFPGWEKIKTLCREAAALFPGIGFQAWDVGLGETGPVFVELNFGGDPMLVQAAHSKGLHDEEFRTIIERCPDPSEHRDWWK